MSIAQNNHNKKVIVRTTVTLSVRVMVSVESSVQPFRIFYFLLTLTTGTSSLTRLRRRGLSSSIHATVIFITVLVGHKKLLLWLLRPCWLWRSLWISRRWPSGSRWTRPISFLLSLGSCFLLVCQYCMPILPPVRKEKYKFRTKLEKKVKNYFRMNGVQKGGNS